jgi:hypothetical protein
MLHTHRALPAALVVAGGLFLSGCGENKPAADSPSPYDRQERALHDPFGYSPNAGKPDISGGGIGEYHDDAMKKDLDHVLNP